MERRRGPGKYQTGDLFDIEKVWYRSGELSRKEVQYEFCGMVQKGWEMENKSHRMSFSGGAGGVNFADWLLLYAL